MNLDDEIDRVRSLRNSAMNAQQLDRVKGQDLSAKFKAEMVSTIQSALPRIKSSAKPYVAYEMTDRRFFGRGYNLPKAIPNSEIWLITEDFGVKADCTLHKVSKVRDQHFYQRNREIWRLQKEEQERVFAQGGYAGFVVYESPFVFPQKSGEEMGTLPFDDNGWALIDGTVQYGTRNFHKPLITIIAELLA